MKSIKYILFAIILAEITMYLMIASLYAPAMVTLLIAYICLHIGVLIGIRKLCGLPTVIE